MPPEGGVPSLLMLTAALSALIAFSLSTGSAVQAVGCDSPQLLASVTSFWQHLQDGQKDQALEYVTRDSWKAFLSVPYPPFRSWTLEKTEAGGEGECLVSVTIPRDLSTGTFNSTVKESWVRRQEGWKVRIADRTQNLRDSYRSSGLPSPRAGRLEILPRLLKIHFLSPDRQGILLILNGLDEDRTLQEIDLDTSRFEVVEAPQTIAAGESARLVLRYRGQETDKDLRSRLEVTFEQGESIEVDVLYNYLSRGTRALLGLTPEEAQKLRRGDKVEPSIKVPKQPPPQRR